MSIQRIVTAKAPAAVGPYSQACVAGGFIFASGQGGLLPESGRAAAGGIKEQAEQAVRNLEAVLKEAGADLSKVVKTTCFLTDMDDFSAFNEVYGKYFVSKPARSCVAVKQLPLGIMCEIEAIAYLE